MIESLVGRQFDQRSLAVSASLPGDLAHMSQEGVRAVVDHATELFSEAVLRHVGEFGQLPDHIKRHVDGLHAGINSFAEMVKDSSNYPLGAREIIAFRNNLARSKSADSVSVIAERLSHSKGAIFVIDVDGTLTIDPDSYLRTHVPGGRIAEPRIDKEGIISVLPQTRADFVRDLPGVYYSVGRDPNYVKIRLGVREFFAGDHGIPGVSHNILSASFEPFVRGVLDQAGAGQSKDLTVWAVTHNNVVPTAKSLVVQHIALSNPDKAIFYLGDGSSDASVVLPEAAELVAGYFALNRGSFERELKANRLPHVSYSNMFDVIGALRQAQSISKENTVVSFKDAVGLRA